MKASELEQFGVVVNSITPGATVRGDEASADPTTREFRACFVDLPEVSTLDDALTGMERFASQLNNRRTAELELGANAAAWAFLCPSYRVFEGKKGTVWYYVVLDQPPTD